MEDTKLVAHIRDVFFALKDFSVGHGSSPMPCSIKSTSLLVNFCLSLCIYNW